MKKVFVFLTLIMMVFMMLPARAYSETGRKTYLVIIDRVNLDDYTTNDLPNIHKIIQNGCVGFMNTLTGAKTANQQSAYLTIGTGTRSNSDDLGSLCFNGNEKYLYGTASQMYHIFNLREAPSGRIVNIGHANLDYLAGKMTYKVTPGLLGKVLKSKGVNTYVFGNSDIYNDDEIKHSINSETEDSDNSDTTDSTFISVVYKRFAALIGMDENGVVRGDVSDDILLKDKKRPFFEKTNYDKIYQKISDIQSGLVIIDTGDTSRADDFSNYSPPKVSSYYKVKALGDADKFLGRIMSDMGSDDTLIVATPYPASSDIKTKNLLTPLLIYGNGYGAIENGGASGANAGGVVDSDTTNRQGIVTNTDIAPTILKSFDIKPPYEMLGHNIYSYNIKSDKVSFLNHTNDMVVSVNIERPDVLRAYVIYDLIVLLAYTFLYFTFKKYVKYVFPFILSMMTFPLTFLLMPLFGPVTEGVYFTYSILLTVLIDFLIIKCSKSELRKYIIISFLTSALISVDLLLKSPLMKCSVLGYDAIYGARFYGIGNEYMGVYLGSTLTFVMGLLQQFNKKNLRYIAILIFAFVFSLIILPQYGAKVGGFITGFMAFGPAILLMFNVKLNKKVIATMFAFMVVLLTCMFVIVSYTGNGTHIAQTATMVKNEGFKSLLLTFLRKGEMELKLIRYTIWSWILIITPIIMLILSYKPTNTLKEIFKKNPYIYDGFVGGIIGMLIALAFNDAGIIAAATLSIFIFPPLLILIYNHNIGKT